MTCWAGCARRFALLLWLGLLVGGCNPSGPGPSDEQKEPHFLAGKELVIALDYNGAIQSFEKALQVNPQSAAAHFELGCLYDDKEPDPAAAIYHYQHVLKLRPGSPNADLAKSRIPICKQALASSVMLGPVTDKVQRQMEQTAEENKLLKEENKRLKEDMEKWSAYVARLQTLTNSGATAPVLSSQVVKTSSPEPGIATGSTRRSNSVASTSSLSSAPSGRTHAVKSGETPSLIARKYGVKIESLMTANPGLDAHRLRVGQVLRIPSS
jgi:LysM repeat protein